MTDEDGMKDKISMALKDPILQMGFEVICSKLSRLEKENAQLRLKLDTLEGQTPWQDIKDKSEIIGKLTKAKELLRKFLDAKSIEETCVAESEAEQFLKDREVEK